MHGYGTMFYENGQKHIGYFKNGIRAGLGMEVNPVSEPRINKGIFEGDRRIGPNWANNFDLN